MEKSGTGLGNKWLGFFYNKYKYVPDVTDRVLTINLLIFGLTIINHSGARTSVDITLRSNLLFIIETKFGIGID